MGKADLLPEHIPEDLSRRHQPSQRFKLVHGADGARIRRGLSPLLGARLCVIVIVRPTILLFRSRTAVRTRPSYVPREQNDRERDALTLSVGVTRFRLAKARHERARRPPGGNLRELRARALRLSVPEATTTARSGGALSLLAKAVLDIKHFGVAFQAPRRVLKPPRGA